MVKKQTSKQVKCLRIDNDLEFCSEKFNNFCKEHGILRHRTVRYTPQQNGIVERLNRTIMDRVIYQMSNDLIPEKFWAKVVSYTVYTINRCPHHSTNFLTPEEKWSKHPPNLQNLRIFGCIGFVHQSQRKLKPRAIKCMFLSFIEEVKGFRMWHLIKKRCITSKDVIIKEDTMFMLDKPNKTLDSNYRPNDIEVEHPPNHESNKLPSIIEEETDSSINLPPIVEEVTQKEEDLSNYYLAIDRQRRTIVHPSRYSKACCVNFALNDVNNQNDDEPKTFDEAVSCPNARHWINVMNDEMESLTINNTWTLVTLPRNCKTISCKWIYKLKEGVPDLQPPRYKARLVAKGFTQREGIDYNEIFSIVKQTSIRMLFSLFVQEYLELEQLEQLYVKTTFLYGDLTEDIYMNQPQ